MKKENSKEVGARSLPAAEQPITELKRIDDKPNSKPVALAAVIVVVITAVAIFLANTMLLPVIKIYGDFMEPSLKNEDIVLALKTDKLECGDVCFFYSGNSILCRRVIGVPGDSVDIDENGNIFLNGQKLDEPYINEKSLGNCDIEFPYTVPENEYFVLGDNRAVADDSRLSSVGCVRAGEMIGKLVFRVWPLLSE